MAPDTDALSQRQGSILYVDAFDSFSNNIVALLETTLNVRVTVVPANRKIDNLSRTLACFDAVVLGPGPGNPTTSKDIGLFKRILEVDYEDEKPVLGICLGFQSICVTFGATLERLTNPKHGMVTEIYHPEAAIFGFRASFEATQYHSLRVKIGHPLEIARPILHPIQLWDFAVLWSETETCPELMPLAWDVDDAANGGVLMAVEHAEKPFWGIQFHPESICTSHLGPEIIREWWRLALKYNFDSKKNNVREGMASKTLDGTAIHGLPRNLSLLRRKAHWSSLPRALTAPPPPEILQKPYRVHTSKLDVGELTAIELCGSLRSMGYDFIFLESAISRPEVGCHSIIGIVEAGTKILEYTSGERFLNLTLAQKKSHSTRLVQPFPFWQDQTIWDFLASYVEVRKAVGGRAASPFWGGLMGYLSYESGTVSDQFTEDCVGRGRKKSPDTVFAFIKESLVFDHVNKCVYIQSLKPKPRNWMKTMEDTVRSLVNEHRIRRSQRERVEEYSQLLKDLQEANPNFVPSDVRKLLQQQLDYECLQRFLRPAIVLRPKEEEYKEKVQTCLEYIRAGESYELCLTDQARVLIPRQPIDFAWDLYRSLRTKNPAPFAAYLHLSNKVILSSSPERFLSWDRKGTCQMRPIKGTVKKDPGMTREKATRILGGDKEKAENLMIVDLIRHDLHGVVGAGNVEVKKLMVVEEYETVYQLVSVIEGRLQNVKARTPLNPQPQQPAQAPTTAPTTPTPTPTATTPPPPQPPPAPDRYTGLDVLQSAFPPGSMTGAPKLSSVAILHRIEGHQPRGAYSGVLGYMCAGGGGDFSVLIRCAFRDDDETVTTTTVSSSSAEASQGGEGEEVAHEVWRIGAGGAVTALSEAGAEWAEMNAKLESTLAAFVVEGEGEGEEEGGSTDGGE